MFYTQKDGFFILKIKALPNSSKSEIVGIYNNEALKIKIAAPAVEGAANKELIKTLSKKFKVSKSEIEFLSGKNSKIKLIKLPKSKQLMEFIERLESAR